MLKVIENILVSFKATIIFLGQIARLTTLGFKTEDCLRALEMCDQNLDDAALWLIQNAASFHNNNESDNRSPLNVKAIEVSVFFFF